STPEVRAPSLRWHYPASTVVRRCPTPADAVPRSDVEAATLAPAGSPPITRITFPAAPTPADRAGAHVDCFHASRGLPQMAGGSASALSLSRPAQASLTLRPAGLLSRPKATFVTRLRTHAVTRTSRSPTAGLIDNSPCGIFLH